MESLKRFESLRDYISYGGGRNVLKRGGFLKILILNEQEKNFFKAEVFYHGHIHLFHGSKQRAIIATSEAF